MGSSTVEKNEYPKATNGFVFASLLTYLAGIALMMSFCSPYWIESYEETHSSFKNMGLWEYCFDNYIYPNYQFPKYFDGCHNIFSHEYYVIREFLVPGWSYFTKHPTEKRDRFCAMQSQNIYHCKVKSKSIRQLRGVHLGTNILRLTALKAYLRKLENRFISISGLGWNQQVQTFADNFDGLMVVQTFVTLAFLLTFFTLAVMSMVLIRWPLKIILQHEWILTRISFIGCVSSSFLLFLAVAVFGGNAYRRDWLMYPKFNVLSWSYALAVVAFMILAIASVVLHKEANDAYELKSEAKNLVKQMELQPPSSRPHSRSTTQSHAA